MSISFKKMKGELLIKDDSFGKTNSNKLSLIAIIVLFCTSVVFISLFISCKASSKNSRNSPKTKKG